MKASRLAQTLLVYVAGYFAASWMDLASTKLGLTRPGVSEKNVFATTGSGVYDPTSAWLLTAGGAVILTLCVWYAAARAGDVSDAWLRHPARSLGQLHVNPFTAAARAVAPLQLLSLAVAFPLLRVAAAINNVMVYLIGWGPLGALMKWLAALTSPAAGFIIVALTAFFALTFLVSPLAARLIAKWQGDD